jgi:co-chaperonin GroES (HSP10)
MWCKDQMNIDPTKVRPRGPWVLVKTEEAPEKIGSIYVPDGNLLERLGHRSAVVLSVSKGYYERSEKTGKEKFIRHDIQKGDRVVFRGHLKDANTHALPKNHCLIHVNDLIGVLEAGAGLDMALPYDN